jgi:hypothetical protein
MAMKSRLNTIIEFTFYSDPVSVPLIKLEDAHQMSLEG